MWNVPAFQKPYLRWFDFMQNIAFVKMNLLYDRRVVCCQLIEKKNNWMDILKAGQLTAVGLQ